MVVLLLHTEQAFTQARRQLSLRYGHLALGNPAHLDAFLDLYAAWLRAMDGIVPAARETLSVYIARLNALQRLLTEMRQQLEVAVP